MSFIYKKQRKRQREIEYGKVEDFAKAFNFNKSEIADLLGVSLNQRKLYERCGAVGADRYYGMLKGFIQAIEEEAAEKIKKINSFM